MVCSHSFAGVAPGEVPKAEATELAPEAVGASPPAVVGLNRSPEGFLVQDAFCFG